MATYYVRPDGSDSNNGAASSTSGAWATLNKALTVTSTSQNASGIVGGDIIYVAPGTYRRSSVINVAWTSPTSEVRIIGDPTATLVSWGAGVTAGAVMNTTYATNDNTLPSSTYNLIDLQGRDYMTFENMGFASSGHCILANTATSTNIKFKQCRFQGISASQSVYAANSFGVSFFWTFERCVFSNKSNSNIEFGVQTSTTGSNYTLDITIDSCIFCAGSWALTLDTFNNNGVYGRGNVEIFNCLFRGDYGIQSKLKTAAVPVKVRNCTFHTLTGVSLSAGTTNEISEDYNRFINCGTKYSGLTGGSNSKDGSDVMDWGLMWSWGMNVLPFAPYPGGAADNAGTTDSGIAPTKDFYNRDFDATPSVAPAEYLVTSTSSGGGLITHPGMTGGMRG